MDTPSFSRHRYPPVPVFVAGAFSFLAVVGIFMASYGLGASETKLTLIGVPIFLVGLVSLLAAFSRSRFAEIRLEANCLRIRNSLGREKVYQDSDLESIEYVGEGEIMVRYLFVGRAFIPSAISDRDALVLELRRRLAQKKGAQAKANGADVA